MKTLRLPSLLLYFPLPLLLGSALCVAETSNPRPDIVIFISDDHGVLDSEPYGSTDIRTPNMASLAAQGMTFTHAFTASPACGPSRTAMLTGLWPARNGAEPNHMPKRAGVPSLPIVLHGLGYEVAAIGKVAHGTWAKLHDFDVIEGPPVGISDTGDVSKFFATRDAGKPLCLFVGTRHPHVPWSENEGYDPSALKLPPTHVDTAETREMRAKYSTDVTKADKLLGEVRDLAKQKLSGDTVFIYTADHGAQWPFGKWNLYDAGMRVPFIVSWPGHVKSATKSDAMICWPDMLPTLIEIAGGKVPAGIDGKSFAGVLKGSTNTHREQVFTTHSGDGNFNVYPIRSLRDRRWKFILNLHPEFQHQSHISRAAGGDGTIYWKSWLAAAENDPAAAAKVKRFSERPVEELYDLENDPFEQHNLAAEPQQAARLATMRAELKAWMKEQGDNGTMFGTPLRIGEPVTPIAPGQGKSKGAKPNKSQQPAKSL